MKIVGVDLDKGEVSGLVRTDDCGVEHAVIVESDFKALGLGYHMIVGDNIALGAYDHTRTESELALGVLVGFIIILPLGPALLLTRRTEEEIEKRVVEHIIASLIGIVGRDGGKRFD